MTAISSDARLSVVVLLVTGVVLTGCMLFFTTRGIRLWSAPWLMFGVFSLYVVAPLTYRWWSGVGPATLPLLAAVSIFLYSLGSLVGSRLTHGTPTENTALARPWIDTWGTLEFRGLMLGLTAAAFTIAGLFLLQIGPGVVSALSSAIQDPLGSNSTLAQTRLSIRPGNGFSIIWILYILPLISMALLARGVALRKNVSLLIAIGLILSTIAGMILITFRAYILYYLLSILVVFELMRGRRGTARFVSYGALMILVLVALDQLRGLSFNSDIMHRAVTIGDQLQYVVSTYGQTKPYLLGGSYLQDAITLLPGGPRLGFNGTVYHEMGYSGLGTTTVTLIGEAYANFGLLGVLVGFPVYGCIAGVLHAAFLRSQHTIQSMLWYTVIGVSLAKASIAGIGENVFPALAVMGPILVLMAIASRSKRDTESPASDDHLSVSPVKAGVR